MSRKFVHADVSNIHDDESIRNAVLELKNANGEYAVEICRHCGFFTTDPKGDTKKAAIVSVCRECWKEHINQ